jgi:hypothetical protein
MAEFLPTLTAHRQIGRPDVDTDAESPTRPSRVEQSPRLRLGPVWRCIWAQRPVGVRAARSQKVDLSGHHSNPPAPLEALLDGTSPDPKTRLEAAVDCRAPGPRGTAVRAAHPRQGRIIDAISQVLIAARCPMQARDVHTRVEALLGEQVRWASIKATLAGNLKGPSPRFIRVARGRYSVPSPHIRTSATG